MENIVLLVHLLVALAIIGLILMQRGKGAEMGASFGAGASQTLFGASGSGNFFSKMTAIFAFIFFVTSFALAVIAKHSGGSVEFEDDIPAIVEDRAPANDDFPEADASVDAADEAPVADEVPAETAPEENTNDQ